MKIAIGADHAGYELKEYLKEYLKTKNIEVMDFGCDSKESVDYPDYALAVAKYVVNALNYNREDKGILVCGSGSGMCVAANKFSQIRAVNCFTPEIASLAVQHNDANILCLGARFINQELAKEIVDCFLTAKFEGGRHSDRVHKIHSNKF
jgi:ribose 5-phosphate isomerase B